GDEVEFNTERGQKGMQATNVKVTNAAPAQSSSRDSRY
ncbi:MAG: cold shock domain-containing protein, partial [Deinococcota bacterium]|nr:cold shock domain-containing protein [Deinococcota bacterium]